MTETMANGRLENKPGRIWRGTGFDPYCLTFPHDSPAWNEWSATRSRRCL